MSTETLLLQALVRVIAAYDFGKSSDLHDAVVEAKRALETMNAVNLTQQQLKAAQMTPPGGDDE